MHSFHLLRHEFRQPNQAQADSGTDLDTQLVYSCFRLPETYRAGEVSTTSKNRPVRWLGNLTNGILQNAQPIWLGLG